MAPKNKQASIKRKKASVVETRKSIIGPKLKMFFASVAFLLFAIFLWIVVSDWHEYRHHSPEEISNELTRLVTHHPKKEIRENFAEMERKGQITFRVVHVGYRDEDQEAETKLRSDDGYIIVIPENRLFELRTNDIPLDVTLWHEWQHVGEFQTHMFPFTYALSEKVARHQSVPEMSLEDADQIFKDRYFSELRAYSGACNLVRDLKYTSHYWICKIRADQGEDAFRRAVAWQVSQRFNNMPEAEAIQEKMLAFAEETPPVLIP